MAPTFNTMPAEIKDMIVLKGTLLARRADNRYPTIIKAFVFNHYYERITALYRQVNGEITENTQEVWKAKRLRETLKINHLMMVPHPYERLAVGECNFFNMRGDKMLLMNNLQSITIDYTPMSTTLNCVQYTALCLMVASRRFEKLTIKHHRHVDLGGLIWHIENGLGSDVQEGVDTVTCVRFVKMEPDGVNSYQYAVWEAAPGDRLRCKRVGLAAALPLVA
ncbi:hypothetical protein HYFRA_00004994 [Hymenoscyphus fraxineus]|uniref:Uncharacterized protein n=1 Tax=Hymenoscyphus fraxineus TaxID=746836 RepID=A0A9N9KNS7_9HELO|nr:hypothetical protein HYFRA_00004994 [Hymenoscyphus fraxineus]